MLANNLKATRTRLGWSQQQLAEAAGVTRQTIGGIEAAQYAPSAAVALRLAKALGCRVEDLFWLEEELPRIEAAPVGGLPTHTPARVTLAQVNGRWIAHSLVGARAFRAEMIPADGLSEPVEGKVTTSVRLLDDPENLGRSVLLAGCAPALSLWARSAERWHPGLRVHWIHANSTEALESLARGEVHAAGVHLCDPATGEENAPFVRRLLPNISVALVHLGSWEEGFLVQPGNPRQIRAAADLTKPEVRLVNREVGAGSRLLLDTLLSSGGIPPRSVRGYEQCVTGHLAAAEAIVSGRGNVAVSTASVASLYGLSFVPLRAVRYDLAIPADYLAQEPIRQMLDTLHHRWVRTQLEALGGHDTRSAGEIVVRA